MYRAPEQHPTTSRSHSHFSNRHLRVALFLLPFLFLEASIQHIGESHAGGEMRPTATSSSSSSRPPGRSTRSSVNPAAAAAVSRDRRGHRTVLLQELHLHSGKIRRNRQEQGNGRRNGNGSGGGNGNGNGNRNGNGEGNGEGRQERNITAAVCTTFACLLRHYLPIG